MSLRIGLDVGGTFTDLEAVDTITGARTSAKVSSRPGDAARAILDAVEVMLTATGAAADTVSFVGHGTTVVTNMLIERKGAPLGLVTTRGFRDILALGRQARPHVYDYRVRRPAALARRAHRYEVTERLAADGTVLTPLNAADLAQAADAIRTAGLQAVAVCFLHAHRNPAHEVAAAAFLADALPGVFITTSHEAAPEMREFERFSTAAVNAFVGPAAAAYFERLRHLLSAKGVPGAPYTITSNGALVDATTAARLPVRTALSGPAAGVVGIARMLGAHAIDDLVTFDVGGTSTDVAVVTGGTPAVRLTREVAGHTLLAPTADIDVVGAGGGSLARLGPGGTLTVGPDSAGADPGPVAYGRGGTLPTLTDAALVLGRLGDGMRLGGTLTLSRPAAETAISDQIASPLGLTVEQAADGILAVAVANMARTIRSAIVQRGHALSRFTLAAYGGAGPLLAADVAQALGIARIVIPVSPGTLCARAALVGDLARDLAAPVAAPLSDAGLAATRAAWSAMAAEGEAWLAGEAIAAADRHTAHAADLRYEGQSFELIVPCEADITAAALADAFHALHQRERGFALPDRTIEIVTARIRAYAPPPALPPTPGTAEATEPASRRAVTFAGTAMDTPVLARATVDVPLTGPAILTEATATTVVPPGWTAAPLADGTLLLTAESTA